MNTMFRKLSLLLLSLFLVASIKAQEIEIWPGDANNNGVVNNVDLLNIGLAFSETGFPREFRTTGVQFFSLLDFEEPVNAAVSWDFGDGETSDEINPFHTYHTPGVYDVNLSVNTSQQEFCFAFEQVVIGVTLASNCSVIIEPLINQDTNSTIISWSSEVGAEQPVDYIWSFGDLFSGTSNEANPIYDYQVPGTYVTCLSIVDATGANCTTCKSIVVGQNPTLVDTCNLMIVYDEGLAGSNWEAQFAPNNWDTSFSTGVNAVYADCDGDGTITNLDAEVIQFNYEKQHGLVTPDVFVDGVLGEDIPLLIDSSLIDSAYQSGTLVELPIILGNETNSLEDFYGVAFSISYDTSLVQEGTMQMDFILNSWINPDNSTLLSVQQDNYKSGRMEMGVTRTDKKAVSGFGRIGKLSFVIEDDIGSFRTLIMELNQTKLINNKEEIRIVAGNKVVLN